jgi:hypothetical protein
LGELFLVFQPTEFGRAWYQLVLGRLIFGGLVIGPYRDWRKACIFLLEIGSPVPFLSHICTQMCAKPFPAVIAAVSSLPKLSIAFQREGLVDSKPDDDSACSFSFGPSVTHVLPMSSPRSMWWNKHDQVSNL